MAINDATLLARQPASAQRLTRAHRAAIVISAIVDDQGASRVLSRFGDEVWELWPFFEQTNVPPTRKRIDWSRLPQAFREPVKAVMYRYWIAGTPGWSRPSATTLAHYAAKTPLIPQAVLRALFDHAEAILRGADSVLDERDAGLRSAVWGRELLRIRDACFFLLGLLTGMRCEEIGGIEVNATRTEVKDDVTYHWVRSIEHKTKKGPVEYLLPSMGLTVLGVMERWSDLG